MLRSRVQLIQVLYYLMKGMYRPWLPWVRYSTRSGGRFHIGQMICMIYPHYSSSSRSVRQGGYIPDLYDLYDLPQVAGMEAIQSA